jgi:hypothetical protein
VDLYLVTIGAAVRVAPQSCLGVLWLQLHFEDKYHEHIPKGQFSVSRADAVQLVEDAQAAGLTVYYD